ncbi:hypothetical protein [Achromobacter sp. 413638]|uniref:hypothetical protein n=1 Tax=Achromobacter sp. 413638 TaxID=3342385 RepID=UPI003709EF8E
MPKKPPHNYFPTSLLQGKLVSPQANSTPINWNQTSRTVPPQAVQVLVGLDKAIADGIFLALLGNTLASGTHAINGDLASPTSSSVKARPIFKLS